MTRNREVLWQYWLEGPKATTSFRPWRTQPHRICSEASLGVSKQCCPLPELSGVRVLIFPLPRGGTGHLTLHGSEYASPLEMKSGTVSDARKQQKNWSSEVRTASNPAEWDLAVRGKETHLHPFASARASTCKQYCIYYSTLFNIAFWFLYLIPHSKNLPSDLLVFKTKTCFPEKFLKTHPAESQRSWLKLQGVSLPL